MMQQSLFEVSCNKTTDVVVFEPLVRDRKLVPPDFCTAYRLETGSTHRLDIPDRLKTLLQVVKANQVGDHQYVVCIAAMPDRPIRLKVKPSGRCVAYTSIGGSPNCVLQNVHVQVSDQIIPTIESITLTGKGFVGSIKQQVQEKVTSFASEPWGVLA